MNVFRNSVGSPWKLLTSSLLATLLLTSARADFSDPRLATLVIKSGITGGGTNPVPLTLSPSFDSAEFAYNVTIPSEHTYIEVTASPVNDGGGFGGDEVTFDPPLGTPPLSSNQLAIPAGQPTTLTITVSPDPFGGGSAAPQDYTVSVFRGSAGLDSLTVSSTTLSPSFSSVITSYNGSVAEEIESVTVTATPLATTAGPTITVNGNEVPSGVASAPVPLAQGATTPITVIVTSTDGSTATYSANIFRPGASDPDTDDDGIPDDYEGPNGLTVGINDAELDLDGDGLINICEYAFGSAPNDPASHHDPVLTFDANGFAQISYIRAIEAGEGLTYTVEVSSNLSAWSEDVTLTNPGNPGNPTWQDNNGGSPTAPSHRFLRVRLTSTL